MTRDSKECSIMSMETKRPGPEAQRTPGENYEHSDANVRDILKSGLWLAAILFVVFIAMRWTFSMMGKMTPMGSPASPFGDTRVMPPAPRLQVDPQLELKNYCTSQVQSLTSYAWEDSRAGIVQIPVDRAIDLLVEHPLPARAAAEAPAGVESKSAVMPTPADVTGPCGYVAERAAKDAAAAEEAGKPEKK
jgi:hypothetical protein